MTTASQVNQAEAAYRKMQAGIEPLKAGIRARGLAVKADMPEVVSYNITLRETHAAWRAVLAEYTSEHGAPRKCDRCGASELNADMFCVESRDGEGPHQFDVAVRGFSGGQERY